MEGPIAGRIAESQPTRIAHGRDVTGERASTKARQSRTASAENSVPDLHKVVGFSEAELLEGDADPEVVVGFEAPIEPHGSDVAEPKFLRVVLGRNHETRILGNKRLASCKVKSAAPQFNDPMVV